MTFDTQCGNLPTTFRRLSCDLPTASNGVCSPTPYNPRSVGTDPGRRNAGRVQPKNRVRRADGPSSIGLDFSIHTPCKIHSAPATRTGLRMVSALQLPGAKK